MDRVTEPLDLPAIRKACEGSIVPENFVATARHVWLPALLNQCEPILDAVPCRGCGRRDGLDAVVENAVWRDLGVDGYYCLWCLDAMLAAVGTERSEPTKAKLHFAGRILISDEGESVDLSLARDEVVRLAARVEALEAELTDARNLVAEVSCGVTHYGGPGGCGDPNPCVRCKRDEAWAKIDAIKTEALDFQAQAKRAGDRLQETINETHRWEDACEGLRKRVAALEGALREVETRLADYASPAVQRVVGLARSALGEK